MRDYGYILCVLMLFVFPATALCRTPIPCFTKKRGKWSPILDTKCIQYTEKDQRIVNKAYLRLQYYVKEFEPKAKKIGEQYNKLLASWEVSLRSWEQQRARWESLVKIERSNTAAWKDAFFKLKKLKAPKPHWTQNPVLWFSLGVGITAAGFIVGAVLIK